MDPARARSRNWIGFAFGLLAVALPLAAVWVIKEVRSRPPRPPAVAPRGTTPAPAADVDFGAMDIPVSGASVPDPNPGPDAAALRSASQRVEAWLRRNVSFQPYARARIDSLRAFSLEGER